MIDVLVVHPPYLTPSTAMAGFTVANSERASPPSQVHQLNHQEYTTVPTTTPHKEAKIEWPTQVPQGKRPVEKVLLANLPSPSLILPSS